VAGEFEIIEQYFSQQQLNRSDVVLGQGDDCAIVSVPLGQEVAISTDTVVAGTHFLETANPKWVAHKALASNISDLSAMGAVPAWVSMAISLPNPDEKWLHDFCEGFYPLANAHNLQLIGGDTTRGPLSITLTIQGLVPTGEALLRSGAQVGDHLFVSGVLGDSHAGLEVILDESKRSLPCASTLEKRHYMAESRSELGVVLRSLASSCIDISDGLISDIKHIMKRSQVGALIYVDQIPVSDELIRYCSKGEAAWKYALQSGEEYELCFSVPPEKIDELHKAVEQKGMRITKIGEITQNQDLRLFNHNQLLQSQSQGFDHFRESL
jgi:thiamine-monophosphate kinase